MGVAPVKITLSGGPAELAAMDRSVQAAELDRTLKIRHGAGYEHFVADDERPPGDGCDTVVFRWSHRTKIAE
ncbi:DUF5988 family protein [Amycolatopsis sp. PS_44_ISF1]|uniref:DUF5988 family protein n=1 Tax=Amycolatopsis sp. PS_44_ISF1 TaxID=2974917 RepID=UPI0028DE005D|nr:DUF5988 family protein [Amycolatopsis sp. PS_44_ISF1]MDT8909787.1 DUF5988 family protein [Amycolatopsis sp. PS_44_ISF1]